MRIRSLAVWGMAIECSSHLFAGPGLTTSPAPDAAPPPTSSVPLLRGKQLSMIDIAKYDDSATEGQGGAQGLLCLRPGVPVSDCMDEGGDPWCPSMDTPWPTDGAHQHCCCHSRDGADLQPIRCWCPGCRPAHHDDSRFAVSNA